MCSYHKIIIIIKKERQEETLGDDGYVRSINLGDDFTDVYIPPN